MIQVLLDVDRWDRADDATQDAAIAEVARLLPAFRHARTERFTGKQDRVSSDTCHACQGMGGRSPQSGNTDYPDCDTCKNEGSLDTYTFSDPVSHRVAIFVHAATGIECVLVPGRMELAPRLVSRAPVVELAPPGFRELSLVERRHAITRAGAYDLAFEDGTWAEHPFGFVETGPAARVVWSIPALERAQSDAVTELLVELGPIDPVVPDGCLARTGLGTAVPPRSGPSGLLFSRDGKWLAAGYVGEVRISDATTGVQLSHLALRKREYADHVAFSPDGMRLAVATRVEVELFESATGEPLLQLGNAWVGFRDLVWGADGTLVIAEISPSEHLASLRVVDPETGATIRSTTWPVEGQADSIGLGASFDGSRLVTSARRDGALDVWDVARWEVVASVPLDSLSNVALVGDHVLWSTNGQAHASRISDGERRALGRIPATRFVPTPDGRAVAWWTWSDGIGLVDLATGARRRLAIDGPAFAFSPDQTRIASGVEGHGFTAIWPFAR